MKRYGGIVVASCIIRKKIQETIVKNLFQRESRYFFLIFRTVCGCAWVFCNIHCCCSRNQASWITKAAFHGRVLPLDQVLFVHEWTCLQSTVKQHCRIGFRVGSLSTLQFAGILPGHGTHSNVFIRNSISQFRQTLRINQPVECRRCWKNAFCTPWVAHLAYMWYA